MSSRLLPWPLNPSKKEEEKNKNNKEVVNFIFKKLFENLPENLQDNLVRNINQEKFEERLKEIQELIAHKKYERALDYLDMSIQKIEKVYEDDDYIYMPIEEKIKQRELKILN